MDEGKPYWWKQIPGTERFRAVCNAHGPMSWRLVNHKDYPDSVLGGATRLPVLVRGQLTQIWKCGTADCDVQTVV